MSFAENLKFSKNVEKALISFLTWDRNTLQRCEKFYVQGGTTIILVLIPATMSSATTPSTPRSRKNTPSVKTKPLGTPTQKKATPSGKKSSNGQKVKKVLKV